MQDWAQVAGKRRRQQTELRGEVSPSPGRLQQTEAQGRHGNRLVHMALCGGGDLRSELLRQDMQLAAADFVQPGALTEGSSNQALLARMSQGPAGRLSRLPTGGRPLPPAVLERMGAVFGQDLSSVRLIADAQADAACVELNAAAFAQGETLASSSAAWAPGGSSPDHAVEREAEQQACDLDAVLAQIDGLLEEGGGQRVEGPAVAPEVYGPAQGPVLRQVDQPRPRAPERDAEITERHAMVQVMDGFSTGERGLPEQPLPGSSRELNAAVRRLHTQDDPLVMNGCPEESQLFRVLEPEERCHEWEEDRSHGASAEWVRWVVGDPTSPDVYAESVELPLFIDGAPTLDDIMQGNLGDCYFLDLLASVTARDPERILGCFVSTGDRVGIRLFHEQDGAWVPVVFVTDRLLLQSHPVGSADGLLGLVGAAVRVADSPAYSEWWTHQQGDVLTVGRDDRYEMALWVALLEKAFAWYAERFGRTGRGAASSDAGYGLIDQGGWVHESAAILYGEETHKTTQQEVNFNAGAEGVAENRSIILGLLWGAGLYQRRGARTLISASANADDVTRHLIERIEHLRTRDEALPYPSLLMMLEDLRRLAVAVETAADDEAREAALGSLSLGAARQVQPGAWPLLEDPLSAPIWTDLYEQLQIIAWTRDRSLNKPLGVYANHAYSVLDTAFVDRDGAPLAPGRGGVDAMLQKIDPALSLVTLRNPHHEAEPQLPGWPMDGDQGDGVFSLSLERYLRIFTLQEVVEVADTP